MVTNTEKKWEDFISSGKTELRGEANRNSLLRLFYHDEYMYVPKSIKTHVERMRDLIGERLLENEDLDSGTLEKIARRLDPEMAEIAIRKLLKSNPSYQNLHNIFVSDSISDELRKDIFEIIIEKLKETSNGDKFGLLLSRENLKPFWDDIEKVLFSPETSSEVLFSAYSAELMRKDLKEKIKSELIKRGLTLYAKYDSEMGRFIPVYRDERGEEFEEAWPLTERWVSEKIEDKPLCSKEGLFEELGNPNKRIFYMMS